MLCLNCRKQIPEDMRASISSNFCPFCGKNILSPQQMHLKNVVHSLIVQAITRDPNLETLTTPDSIHSLASIVASGLATDVVPGGEPRSSVSSPKVPSLPVSSESDQDPDDVVDSVDSVDSVESSVESSGRDRPVVPAHLKPKNRGVPKPIRREGVELSPSSDLSSAVDAAGLPPEAASIMAATGMTPEDLQALSMLDVDSMGESDFRAGDSLMDLDDAAFFGGDGDASFHDVDGEQMLLGSSNSEMKRRAAELKAKSKKTTGLGSFSRAK